MKRLTLLLLAHAAVLFAQTAQITGLITDASNAVIPSAKVSVTNEGTGIVRKAETNPEGSYAVPLLPPGEYRVLVQANGFRPSSHDGVVLTVNQIARLDFQLEIGQTTEAVTVTASRAVLETGNASVGGVVDNRQMLSLPMNRRQGMAFATLQPNVLPSPNYDPSNWSNSARISINGARDRAIEILFDGSPALAVGPGGAASSLPAYQASLDTVREFRVVTNALSAEYGNTGAGLISIVSKTGTNQLHGSAYDFLRNSNLDANNFFNNAAGIPLSSFKRNQFGGSVGGPVFLPKIYDGRNRTFFFVAYEGLRSATAQNVVRTVPTPDQRRGNFSNTRNASGQLVTIYDPLTTQSAGSTFLRSPFPGNTIPAARFDPVAVKVLELYPDPNAPGLPFTAANNFLLGSAAGFDSGQFDYRIDHALTERHAFYGRYSHGATTSTPPLPFGFGDGAIQLVKSRHLALDYTWLKSNATVVNIHGGYSLYQDGQDRQGYFIDRLPFNATLLSSVGNIYNGLPQFNISDVAALNRFESQWTSPFTTHQYSGSVTHVRGRHTLKIGGEVRRYLYAFTPVTRESTAFSFTRGFTQGPNPLQAGSAAGYGVASLLLGAGSGSTSPRGQLLRNVSAPVFAGYIQDDWKLSRTLTLNLGLRWDLFVPRTESRDQLSWFDPTPRNPLSDLTGLNLVGGLRFAQRDGGRRQYGNDFDNFGPRLGFAYSAAPKVVLRGGFGVLYPNPVSSGSGAPGQEGFFTQTDWVSANDGLLPAAYLTQAFATGFVAETKGALGLAELAGQSFNPKVPVSFASTYNLQWHFSVQTDLPGESLLEASYLGNRGLHLAMPLLAMNQLRPEQLAAGAALLQQVPNPFLGIVTKGPLSGATTTRAQLLRPFPHFDSIASEQPPVASSTYHALGLRFERRFSNGLFLQASYTTAKLIDDSSAQNASVTQSFQNAYDLRSERSLSAQDISQRFVLSFLAPLPFGNGQPLLPTLHPVLNSLIGGWQITGIFTRQSGLPIGLTAPNTSNSFGGGQRPNSTGKSAALSGAPQQRLSRFFDTAQFTQPAPFTFGNVARSLPDVRGPGLSSVDLSLLKAFRLWETGTLQLRAEAFNLTNTPSFGLPGTVLNTPTFGVIASQVNAPRQVQLALRLEF